MEESISLVDMVLTLIPILLDIITTHPEYLLYPLALVLLFGLFCTV